VFKFYDQVSVRIWKFEDRVTNACKLKVKLHFILIKFNAIGRRFSFEYDNIHQYHLNQSCFIFKNIDEYCEKLLVKVDL